MLRTVQKPLFKPHVASEEFELKDLIRHEIYALICLDAVLKSSLNTSEMLQPWIMMTCGASYCDTLAKEGLNDRLISLYTRESKSTAKRTHLQLWNTTTKIRPYIVQL